MITLHNGNETIDLLVNDDSYSYEAIKGEDTLTLYFSHPGYLDIPVGSWCEFYGKRYSLKKDSNFKKQGERNYEYTLVLETAKADTQLWKIRNTVDNRIKFPYTAKPKEHLKLIVDNLNRRSSGWTIGECIEGTEKLINYNHTYALDAINQVAEAYETEYQITETVIEGVHTKTIHLKKVEYNKNNPLTLSYGKGHGFKTGVGRESGDIPPEIILVETTDRNIDYSKYGAKELLMPKSQTIRYDGSKFENEDGFNADIARTYKTDEYGTSVMRADRELSTAKEDSLDCTEIYPSRIGTISEVLTVVEKGNTFYDFKDKDIPQAMDFSQYRIDGEKATVIFQSGMLSGKEFELEQSDKKLTGYVHSERRFKLVSQEIDGITMPDGNTWMPKVGDKYAVFGIQLPDAYICDNATRTGASWDVFKEAVKYLYEHENKEFTFTGTLDGIWAKKRWLQVGGKIVLGGFVNFTDNQFHPEGSLIRMVGIKRYVNNPYSPEIELSNSPVGTSISNELNKIETNEVTVDENHKKAQQFTKRYFRDAKETMEMLAGSLLNFSGAINPITVATMQMLVGDESLQYRFVDSKTNPGVVNHVITYNSSTKVLHAPSGIIQRMMLGLKTLSNTHAAGDYKYWDMAEYYSPSLIEPEKKFYLYAKCSKDNQSGTFRLEESAIGLEQIDGYYHLLVGILNSENNGERSFATLYGFTEILPGRITTDKIVSSDGESYLDLFNASMKLGDALMYNLNDDKSLYLKCILSEYAQLGGWTVKNGKLVSKDDNVYLDGNNGIVRLKGTIQHSTGVAGNYSDVDMFTLPPRTTIMSGTYISMGVEKEDIGKRCLLTNNSALGSNGYYRIGTKKFGWTEGGAQVSGESEYYIVSPQETVEMSCFELPKGSNVIGYSVNKGGYWKITNRFNKEIPQLVAMGKVTNSSSGASISGQSIAGSTFSVQRNGTGNENGTYTITLPSFFSKAGEMLILLTGIGVSQNASTPIKATLISQGGNTFVVRTSDDSTDNAGSFSFVVYSYGGFYI